ncbi:MAG: hypothetical protein HY673_13900 [Chloroflexi bacterium]|nr:hypothetical protein [Chloroflexota bacterium]
MAMGLGALIYYFVASVDRADTKELMLVLIGLGLCLSVLAWTFKQKKGAIWWPGWIVLPFLPFGWIVVVFIERPSDKALLQTSLFPNWVARHIVSETFDLKYWRGIRQSICWAGIIATVELIVLALTVPDSPNAPLWTRIGSQSSIPFVVGGFLLYGALRK